MGKWGAAEKRTYKRLGDELLKAALPRELEFYRLLFDYLQLAHESPNAGVKGSLESGWNRMRMPKAWRHVRGHTFETWLEENKWELAQPSNRVLEPGEAARPGEVTIAVRLDRGVNQLKAELEARLLLQVFLALNLGSYTPVREQPLQLDALRDYWIWYKADQAAQAQTKPLSKVAREFFVMRFYNEYRQGKDGKAPYPFIGRTKKTKGRQSLNAKARSKLRREVKRGIECASAIVFNVTQGQFPGNYDTPSEKAGLKRFIESSVNKKKVTVEGRTYTRRPKDDFSGLARRLVFQKGNYDPLEVSNSTRDPEPYR